MLELKDDYCKIIAADDAERKKSLTELIYVNIDKSIAERLLTEPCLEVRKFKSERKAMFECAVVKCSEGRFWNIPRKILQVTERKK